MSENDRAIGFSSYAHADDEFRGAIRRIHRIWEIQQQLRVDIWADDKSAGGSDWRREIDTALERASLGILLISDQAIVSSLITCDTSLIFDSRVHSIAVTARYDSSTVGYEIRRPYQGGDA